MDPLVTSLVSANTALVASIFGPIVTLAVARRQVHGNVVSSDIETITRLAHGILKRECD